MSPIDSMPPVDQSLLPADVRSGGAKAQQLYSVAQQFENLLVDQLTTQLADSSGLGDSGDGSSGSSQSPYASLLPGALSQAVSSGGGLGLASELYRSLSLQQQPQSPQPSQPKAAS